MMEEEGMTDQERAIIRSGSGDFPFFEKAPSYCFYCGEKLTIPAVMWHGRHGTDIHENTEMWLHPKCAAALSMKLMRDADELRFGREEANTRYEKRKAEEQ